MIVGLMRIEIFISDANNLKDKRGVMRSLLENIRRRFNVSVIEEGNIKWRRGTIGIGNVATNRVSCSRTLNKVLEFIKSDPRIEIIDYTVELL